MLKSYNSNKLFPLKCLPPLWHFGILLIFLIIDNSWGIFVRTLESSHNRRLLRHIGQNPGIFSSHSYVMFFQTTLVSTSEFWTACFKMVALIGWVLFLNLCIYFIVEHWYILRLFFRSTQDQEDKNMFDICCLWILVILAFSCAFHFGTL